MHYENAILGISVISFPEIWLADGVIYDVRINNPIQYNTKDWVMIIRHHTPQETQKHSKLSLHVKKLQNTFNSAINTPERSVQRSWEVIFGDHRGYEKKEKDRALAY